MNPLSVVQLSLNLASTMAVSEAMQAIAADGAPPGPWGCLLTAFHAKQNSRKNVPLEGGEMKSGIPKGAGLRLSFVMGGTSSAGPREKASAFRKEHRCGE